MKKWFLVMMCAFLYVMPVQATELTDEEVSSEALSEEASSEEEQVEVQEEESVSEPSSSREEVIPENIPSREEESSESISVPETEDTENQIPVESTEEIPAESIEEMTAEVEIPDLTGMSEADAIAVLNAIVLPDGSAIEVIKDYKYTDAAEQGIIYSQDFVGLVSAEDAKKVTIFISNGIDPTETMTTGYADPLDQKINSRYGINWESLPVTYEYNWDNSQNCWEHGVWINGVCYKTPKGTYNTNVRHLIQLYTDGTYVYTHIVFSRDYEAAANGNWFKYYVDGNMAAFQVETYNGTQLANNNLSPGTYEVVVHHAAGSGSYNVADGASAYYTVFDSQVNAHLEMRIPLSELAEQNANIDAESFGSIEFFTPNLMKDRVTASGASTFPFASAAAALILVPGTAWVLNKKRKSTKKDSNE